MNKKLLIFSLLIIGLIGFGTNSCKKKKGSYVVQGNIKDKTFNTGMANQILTVEVQEAGSTTFSVHSTITTDATGNYQLEVERGLIDKIRVSGTKTNYFDIEFTLPVSLLSVEETTTFDFGTTAKAWARLIFVHQSGDPNAELQYTKTEGKQDCATCCPKTTQSLYGFVNDTIICVNDGNSNYSYNYLVVGTPTFNTKQCYTPAFDTGQVVLNY